MVTEAQNRANLRSAERVVWIEMGVDRQDGAAPDLTFEQRGVYVVKLSQKILATPGNFTAFTLATAREVVDHGFAPLADASFNWSDFRSAVVDNAVKAGDSVADVGRGVQTGLSTLRWGIPLLIVAALAVAVWAMIRKGKKISA